MEFKEEAKDFGLCKRCGQYYNLKEWDLNQAIPKIMKEDKLCYHHAYLKWRLDKDKDLMRGIEKRRTYGEPITKLPILVYLSTSIDRGPKYEHITLTNQNYLYSPGVYLDNGWLIQGIHYTCQGFIEGDEALPFIDAGIPLGKLIDEEAIRYIRDKGNMILDNGLWRISDPEKAKVIYQAIMRCF